MLGEQIIRQGTLLEFLRTQGMSLKSAKAMRGRFKVWLERQDIHNAVLRRACITRATIYDFDALTPLWRKYKEMRLSLKRSD